MATKCQHGNTIDPPGNNCLFCIATASARSAFDHTDAWNVAHHKSQESNLARCYLELRQLAKSMWEGPISDEEQERLKVIIHSNDL